jgi:hypothetical protein
VPSAGYTLLRRAIRSKHMVNIDPWTDEAMSTVLQKAIPDAKNVPRQPPWPVGVNQVGR